MPGAIPSDGTVVVTYTVHGALPPTTTIPTARPGPVPAVTHQPLPLTGAPLTLEMIGSFGLLLAGFIAAVSARRRPVRS